jgi:hypothetical protein
MNHHDARRPRATGFVTRRELTSRERTGPSAGPTNLMAILAVLIFVCLAGAMLSAPRSAALAKRKVARRVAGRPPELPSAPRPAPFITRRVPMGTVQRGAICRRHGMRFDDPDHPHH